MTLQKPRAPLTTDAALARIAGQVPGGWAVMAARLGREKGESLVRAWGDPARRERVPFEDAIQLDLLYREAGGDGAPLFETYAYQLDHAGVFRFADEVALGRLTADAIREGGEAFAALVVSAQPGAEPRCHRETLLEVEQLIEALQRTHVVVKALAQGTGLVAPQHPADHAGEPHARAPPD